MRLINADALKKRAIRMSTVKEHCYMKAVGTHEIDKAPTVASVEATTSCEDPNTEYITFPDGLRLIIRGGEYAGWYVCGGTDGKN